MNRQFFVYILTNKIHTVLYTGVTNHLRRRLSEHRKKVRRGFTARYNVDRLVYYEIFDDPYSAISREKQIKGGSRAKKIELVNSLNPEWIDLYDQL